MGRMKAFRKYLIFFFVFAQDSYIPFVNVSKFLVYLPRIVLILVISSFVMVTITAQGRIIENLDRGSANMLFIFTLSYSLPAICVAFEHWLKPSAIPSICTEISIVSRFMENKLKIPFKINHFERHFMRKMAIIFSTAIFAFVLKFIIKSHTHSQTVGLLIFVMILLKCIAALHILFYVEFVRFSLESLNSHVSALRTKSIVLHVNTMIKHFQDLKYVHFKLRKIISIVNKRFGWIINGLIFESFLHITNAVYWIFLYHIVYPTNRWLIIRKCLKDSLLVFHSTKF